ncbi:hypothetical protein HYV30_01810 [Candidatus Kaiserbacteria bacterium]|nr:hypothetical protein [Candidatus Kaiserbacteria bacterium]
MKEILKWVVATALGLIARLVMNRYRPGIVMVTGSVGKTSTKDAVAAVLAAQFYVKKSEKSFNSEFGVPFTILGVENPWGNPLAWLKVVKSALALLLLPNHYPNLLVLEVGADKPGDLARILRIVTPDALVVTRLPEIPVHVEAYASPEEVREEEFSPAYALPTAAPLIICADDRYAVDMAVRTPSRIISYGLAKDATVRLSDIDFYSEDGTVAGMRATVSIGSVQKDLVVRGAMGKTQILPLAAALAVGAAFDIPLSEMCETLSNYQAPAGRGRLLVGKNGSALIDDSYNASPAAVEEALMTLRNFPRPFSAEAPKGRRIAVLGDMLELGRYSVMEHERVGALADESADIIVAVGIRARAFAAAAQRAQALVFENSRAAAAELPNLVQPGDVILIKGSQSIRTERVVEALLADPADAKHLVRQDKEWKRRA